MRVTRRPGAAVLCATLSVSGGGTLLADQTPPALRIHAARADMAAVVFVNG